MLLPKTGWAPQKVGVGGQGGGTGLPVQRPQRPTCVWRAEGSLEQTAKLFEQLTVLGPAGGEGKGQLCPVLAITSLSPSSALSLGRCGTSLVVRRLLQEQQNREIVSVCFITGIIAPKPTSSRLPSGDAERGLLAAPRVCACPANPAGTSQTVALLSGRVKYACHRGSPSSLPLAQGCGGNTSRSGVLLG